jgi:hypothetical protein
MMHSWLCSKHLWYKSSGQPVVFIFVMSGVLADLPDQLASIVIEHLSYELMPW